MNMNINLDILQTWNIRTLEKILRGGNIIF